MERHFPRNFLARVSLVLMSLAVIVILFSGCSTAKLSPGVDIDSIGGRAIYLEENELGKYGDRFYEIIENQPISTSDETISTFSVDVDTAAYAIIRKYINEGVWRVPKDAVRIEEMINYFSYDYPAPEGDVPFSLGTEFGVCPWNNEKYLVRISLKGREIEMEDRVPCNLVFLIDVSGSMESEDKLPLLKTSFSFLVEKLTAEDRVSIVIYAGASGVVLEGAKGNEKDKILNAINKLKAGGSTAGSKGIQTAYEIAEKYKIENGNNRVILATDGDFNVGITATDKLKDFIQEKLQTGIYLSVLGFGLGNLGDANMETLADWGNGNYAYIDSQNEAQKVLDTEMQGTLFTIAKDVKIQVEFNPETIASYRLIGYENRLIPKEAFDDDKRDAGDIGAGHTVTAFYELVPARELNNGHKVFDLRLRYKEPDQDESKEITESVSFDLKEKNSADFNFACSVIEFSLLLRDSVFKGSASMDHVIQLANANLGNDEGGYRAEFVYLVEKYKKWLEKNK